MIYLRIISFILLFCLSIFNADAGRRPVATIPFELSGTYIIITARVNQGTPLHFIFDTGLRHTIITQLDETDLITLGNQRRMQIQGLGLGQDITALASDNNVLSFGRFRLKERTVYVMEEDLLQLSEMNGRKINGIIGIDLIRSHVAHIDYSRRRIYLYNPDNYTPPRNFSKRPLVIENNKIYMMMTLLDGSLKLRTIKMFIDTGAKLNAWFQTVSNQITDIPEKRVYTRIGTGFSGDVYGYLAKIPQICLDDYCFNQPIVAFPDSATIANVMHRSDRDGTIGSELLSRFNLIINLRDSSLYFRPNDRFKLPFRYNIAGIEIAQAYYPLPGFTVISIWDDSPAHRAGLKTGDVIVGVNNENAITMNINEVRAIFEQTSRRPLQLLVNRGFESLLFEIEMKDLL